MLYHLVLFTFQLPWLLLLIGALIRLRHVGGRLRRLQVEGTALIVGGALAAVAMYHPQAGYDRFRVAAWGEFFDRAEMAAFLVGLLFFSLGYFLERRPRPGLRPWPFVGKAVSAVAILLFAVLGLIVHRNVALPWIDLPWPLGRLVFGLGCFPFAIGYLIASRNPTPPPADD